MICRYHNIDCDNANENGYCKTSACVNPKFVVTIYPTDMEHYIGDKSKEFHFEELHGSLKDSDAIIKDIKEFYCKKCKTKDEDKCWVCIVNNCVRIIDDAPTILEASKEN